MKKLVASNARLIGAVIALIGILFVTNAQAPATLVRGAEGDKWIPVSLTALVDSTGKLLDVGTFIPGPVINPERDQSVYVVLMKKLLRDMLQEDSLMEAIVANKKLLGEVADKAKKLLAEDTAFAKGIKDAVVKQLLDTQALKDQVSDLAVTKMLGNQNFADRVSDLVVTKVMARRAEFTGKPGTDANMVFEIVMAVLLFISLAQHVRVSRRKPAVAQPAQVDLTREVNVKIANAVREALAAQKPAPPPPAPLWTEGLTKEG